MNIYWHNQLPNAGHAKFHFSKKGDALLFGHHEKGTKFMISMQWPWRFTYYCAP